MGYLQFNLFFIIIEKAEFGEVVGAIGFYFYFLFKPPAPFHPAGWESAGEVGIKDGMNLYGEAFMLLHNEVGEVLQNFVLQNEGRGNLTGTVATWTNFTGIDGGFRLHSLPGNLHQTKLGD